MLNPYPSYAAAMEVYKGLVREMLQSDEPDPERLQGASEFVNRARETGRVIDEEAERMDLQSALNYTLTLLTRHSAPDLPDPLLDAFDESNAPMLESKDCPYVGLRAFSPWEADRFSGRTLIVNDLVGRMSESNILVVTGTSGSGKSSLVLAGLLPALRAGAIANSASWRFFVPLVPGANPINNLVRALAGKGRDQSDDWARLSQNPEWVGPTADALRKAPNTIVALLGPGAACLVVDQAEEIFSSCRDEDLRQAFFDVLTSLADAGHKVILTMRSEYVEDKSFQLPPAFAQSIFSLDDRITRPEELREMIEAPANKVGLKIDPEIVTDIVTRLSTIRSALPILQITMTELWAHRKRNRITFDTYTKAVGDPIKLLDRVAERTYAALPMQTRTIADGILMKLVQPGPLEQIVSNRVPRSEFKGLGAEVSVQEALDALETARLVRKTEMSSDASADLYEIAHEAIVRNWTHLAALIEKSRKNLGELLQLSALAEAWESRGRPDELLLTGSALDWASKLEGREGLNERDSLFLTKSRDRLVSDGRVAKTKRLSLVLFFMLVAVLAAWIQDSLDFQERANILKSKEEAVDDYMAEFEKNKSLVEKLKLEQNAALTGIEKSIKNDPNYTVTEPTNEGLEMRKPEFIIWHSLPTRSDPSAGAIIELETARGFGPAHHFYVNRAGVVVEGRGVRYQGKHTLGFDDKSLSILFNGDESKKTFYGPDELKNGIAFTRSLMRRFGIKAENVLGHDEANARLGTGPEQPACPGRNVDMRAVRSELSGPRPPNPAGPTRMDDPIRDRNLGTNRADEQKPPTDGREKQIQRPDEQIRRDEQKTRDDKPKPAPDQENRGEQKGPPIQRKPPDQKTSTGQNGRP